jgi:hypothetical protein
MQSSVRKPGPTPKPEHRKVPVCVTLTPVQLAWVKDQADKAKVTYSDVVRAALALAMENE